MTVISWITTVLCLIGSVLNVKKIKLCFVLWLTGNALWLCIDVYNGMWSRAVLDVVQSIITIWGIKEWKGEKHG